MFEVVLPLLLYVVNSIAGGIYVQKFFRGRYGRKIILFVWTSLYFIIQSLVLERLDIADTVNYIVKVTLDIAVVLLLQMFLYEKDLLKQLFVAISFIAGKEIIKYIIVVLMYGHDWIIGKFSMILAKNITTVEEVEMWCFILNVITLIVYVSLYALLMLVYLSVISRKFIRKNEQFRTDEYAFLIFPSVTSLCISVTLKMLIYSAGNGMTVKMFDKIPALRFWVTFTCLLLWGINISFVMLFQKLVQLGEEERKRVMLENQMLQMQREIEEIQDIYADMRGLRHDMKSHLESIAAVVRRISGGNKEELDDYIEKMDITVSRLDFAYRTGNPITDVIIHQKKQEAEKRNIFFEADFIYPSKQQIDVYDIGIVLNNALENAIEASAEAPGKKSINLRSYMKGNLFFIEVENDFLSEIIFDSETGFPISSKEDKQHHGLGMENIQRCAKKYKGDIDITIQDTGDKKKFILTVMMYEK